MNSISLVTRREFRAQIRSKAAIISTLVMAALIIGAGILGKFLLNDDEDPDMVVGTVGVTEETAPLKADLEEIGLTVVDVSGEPETALEANEDLDAVISGDPSSPTIYALESSSELDTITQVTQIATSNHLLSDNFGDAATDEVKQEFLDSQALSVEILGEPEFDPVTFLVGVITVSLIYFVIVMGVSILATGVVEEKSSRVVEVLLATIRPRELLMGKFIGIGFAIFIMVAIYVAAMVIAASIAGILPDINITSYIPMLLVWVVLGYIIYASITGGLAATVSRQEDIGAVTTPMIFLSMVPFYFALFYVPENPDSMLTQILGYVPFFGPFILPVRAAVSEVPLSDTLISIGACLVFIPILASIAGKIYERSILHTGARMKVMDALRRK